MPKQSFDGLLSHFKIDEKHSNPSKGKYMAFCPAHSDKSASLSIAITQDKALIFCHAGCNINDILKSANLSINDLFLGDKRPMAIYQYRKVDGSLSHEKVKYPAPPPRNKTFSQRRLDNDAIVDNLDGINHIPYNYPQLVKAIKDGETIVYTEGEKDADTAKMLGFNSTTMGGASDWKDEYRNYFRGSYLILIPDKDDAGFSLTNKMIDSLKTVCKSLKTVILPIGKDLTDWAEAGNSNLSTLITDAPELVKTLADGIVMTKDLSGYWFKVSNDLNIVIEHLSDEMECIIKVIDKGNTIHTSKLNLLATRSISEFVNKLTKIKHIDGWDAIINKIINMCSDITSDAGATVDIDEDPTTMTLDYLLKPLLIKNEPTTMFTAGGVGKSIFADYIAVLVAHGICPNSNLPFMPEQANVLYLDWETEPEVHRRYIKAIKRGLEIDAHSKIYYRKISHTLSQVYDAILREIKRLNIGLVIIDSQMAATSGSPKGMTEAQIAGEYYNILATFNCTTLTIDHITKIGMSNDGASETPYGSVVKYNRARSIFELKMDDGFDNQEHKEYALVHRKFNLGIKSKPLGVALDFDNADDKTTLVSLKFSTCELADNQKLSKTLKRSERIINVLKRLGTASISEIADELGEESQKDSIGTELSRHKELFVKISNGVYGLVSRYSEGNGDELSNI